MHPRRAWATLSFGLFLVVGACAMAGPAEPVDLNRATVPELMQVKGMTASWAGRIVRFRPYRSKADLVESGVVPADVYRRFKDGVIAHRVAETGPHRTKKKWDPIGQDTR